MIFIRKSSILILPWALDVYAGRKLKEKMQIAEATQFREQQFSSERRGSKWEKQEVLVNLEIEVLVNLDGVPRAPSPNQGHEPSATTNSRCRSSFLGIVQR